VHPVSEEGSRFRLGFLAHVEGRSGDPKIIYRDVLEQIVAADELGFDVAWLAQHHFQTVGGGLPSPWPFLAAVAERTRHIHLSTAVVVLPLEDPVRLAEDLAVVNTLSGGRVEIGVGSGFDTTAYQALGRDFAAKRELTSDGVDALRSALSGQPIAGTARILHPAAPEVAGRIWQAVFSEEGARYVARSRSNLLLNRATYGYDEPTDVVQRPWADAYRDEWDGPRPGRIGISRLIFPAADRRSAIAQLEEGVERMAAQMVAQGRFPAGLDTVGYLSRLHGFYGHPEEIVTALAAEQVLPVATDLLAQFNPGVPTQEAALRAIELLATEVAPALGWRSARQASPAAV
jgi:alkanesulfonate monooxygenase SsuD/methylene tetrahydromethanopterin reductase-like flavin-dependent oxidoreductase (luciferase family)